MRSDRPNRVVQFSLVLFAIGLVAIAALFATPMLDDGQTAPTLVYVLTMCAPIGLVIALIATVLAGRVSKPSTKKRRKA